MTNKTNALSRAQSAGSACERIVLPVAIAAAIFAAVVASPPSAQALPSFARQTGQPCGACHTDFPQLTPFGRRFKLGAYTLGGGENSDEFKKTFGDDAKWVPPIAVMGIFGYTRQNSLAAGGPPAQNDSVVAQTFSAFYGGAITEHIGAFIQGTYDNPAHPHWDNTDIRYANSTQVGNVDVTYGITVNNNPTVQDVWNTTPAWGFPFVSSSIANTPNGGVANAKAIIDSSFAQQVVGVGAYTFIADTVYLEAAGYRTLSPATRNSLGIDPTTTAGPTDRVSPYFRIAAEPHWGNNYLELGAFGMQSKINPWANLPLDFTTFPMTDTYTDWGADGQYQYLGDDNAWSLTLRAVYIHENQKLDASSFFLGTNPTDTLNTFRAQASFVYGRDGRVVLTGGYFDTWGTADPTIYAANSTFKPDSNGWIAEIAYIPIGMSTSALWPYFNARIGLQYIWYNKFNGASVNYDGMGANAKDNNTLFGYIWFAM